MSRMNERTSKKAQQTKSVSQKNRTDAKKKVNTPTGKITKSMGNKKNS